MVVDLWDGEDVIITLEEEGADTVTNIDGRCTSLKISGGAVPNEMIRTFGKVDLLYQKGKEKMKVDLEVLPNNLTLSGPVHGTTKTTNELRSTNQTKRWRVIIWFLPYENHRRNTTTTTIVVPIRTGEHRRLIFVDAYGVAYDQEIAADGQLKGTLSFEVPAFTPEGRAAFFDGYTSSGNMGVLVATTHSGSLTWNTTTRVWIGSYRT